jgi:hypothetical protein
MNRPVPPFEYLLDSSKTSLHEFWNLHLNDAANRRKEMQRLVPDWIEATAMALLAEWFSLHGETLVAAAGADPETRAKLLERLRGTGGLHAFTENASDADTNGAALLGATHSHRR